MENPYAGEWSKIAGAANEVRDARDRISGLEEQARQMQAAAQSLPVMKDENGNDTNAQMREGLNAQAQEAQMQRNIRGIDSPFHQAFLKDKHLHEIVSGKVHLTFRSVTNILYNLMPALNITFLEKHFCSYAIVRYIMEKYHTSWQEIMAERVI